MVFSTNGNPVSWVIAEIFWTGITIQQIGINVTPTWGEMANTQRSVGVS